MRRTKINLNYSNLTVKETHGLLGGKWAAIEAGDDVYKLFVNVDRCLHWMKWNLTEYVFICKHYVNTHIVTE